LKWFGQDIIRANSARLRFVEWLKRAHEQHHGNVFQLLVCFDVLADFITTAGRHENVCENYIRFNLQELINCILAIFIETGASYLLMHDFKDAAGEPLPNLWWSLAGIISFYAIIHLRRKDVARALKGMHRVLEPGGRLLVSFHEGEGELQRDEWYGQPVSIYVTLFGRKEMESYLEAAGFEVERVVEREPYEFEYPTRRVYVFGRKPTPSNSR